MSHECTECGQQCARVEAKFFEDMAELQDRNKELVEALEAAKDTLARGASTTALQILKDALAKIGGG